MNLGDGMNLATVAAADHAHAFTFSGYPDRGSDIFGIADTSDKDYKPFSTLSYSNGPGHRVRMLKMIQDWILQIMISQIHGQNIQQLPFR